MKIKYLYLGLILVFIGCGVSKSEYMKLVDENTQLKEELDKYINGLDKNVALLNMAVDEKNFIVAREKLIFLKEYHPEILSNNEIVKLIMIVEAYEKEQERIKIVEEEERIARERLLNIGRTYDNPILIKGNGRSIKSIVIDILLDKDIHKNKYITIPNYVFDSFNVDSNGDSIPYNNSWFDQSDTYEIALTTGFFKNELSSSKFFVFFQPNNNESKRVMMETNGRYGQPAKRISTSGKLFFFNDKWFYIIGELEMAGKKYLGNIPNNL